MPQLFPGKWHEHVPKNPKDNVRYRRWLLERAEKSQAVRDGLRLACSEDILFYLNVFAWTFDPRKANKTIPFITYPVQDRTILAIVKAVEESTQLDTPCDLVAEKSRDMGATWCCLYAMESMWHWKPGFSFLMMSRTSDLVDKSGDPDSLFWKLDFHLKYLPDWLMPKGWNARKHRIANHFENPETGSTMDGSATTEKVGVGGRRSAMFLDEFSRVDQAADILSGTADTTRCRIFNFTPWGTSHPSYKLAQRSDVRKIRMGWWEHPEKNKLMYRWSGEKKKREYLTCDNAGRLVEVQGHKESYPDDYQFIDDGVIRSPVYDAEDRRRSNRREMAIMWDIDYAGSQYKFFEKATILDLQRRYAMVPFWEGEIECDEWGRNPRLTRISGGPVKLWMNLIQSRDGEVPPKDYYVAGGDISTGTGSSNSCFSIVRRSTREKVLEYATPFLPPERFAIHCVALCRLFCNYEETGALFAWEMQGPGVLFGKRVLELGYYNVYYRQDETAAFKKPTDRPGWVPQADSKRTLLGDYRSALGTHDFINRSEIALEECNSFIVDSTGKLVHSDELEDDDPTGAGINHGDRVIADALCNRLCGPKHEPKPDDEEQESPVGSMAWRRQQVTLQEEEPDWI